MRDLTLRFIDTLRTAGLRISLSESMDAVRAVAAVGVERDLLREALAASLVKEEEDRPLFDDVFSRFFAGPKTRRKGKLAKPSNVGDGQRVKESGLQARTQERPPEPRRSGERPAQEPPEQANDREREQRRQSQGQEAKGQPPRPDPQPSALNPEHLTPSPQPLALSRKALLEKPFKTFDARDVEETKDLVEELARRLRGRLSRRYKRSKHGRLDFRRTFRASVAHGGIPIELRLRGRRPGKLDLMAFCDLSGSVAMVSDFLLALLSPAAEYFRRVRMFAYVDRLCEVSFENGYVVPHETLDLYARSDFGKVLQQFWQNDGEQMLTRNTLVLVLGDARNNRRPPRQDLLARIREKVKKLVWLNPEPRERWNTGDSVIGLYTPVCDLVLGCESLRELLSALKQAW